MSLYRPAGSAVGAGAAALDPSFYSPSVSRCAELLSCAKTAIKVAQRSYEKANNNADNGNGSNNQNLQALEWSQAYQNLAHLRLYSDTDNLSNPSTDPRLEDGLALLRTLEAELQQLQALVRRRGHTNDPTEEISQSVQRLQADTQELLQLVEGLVPAQANNSLQRYRQQQRRKHMEMIQQWFQQRVQEQGQRLKEILKTRGKVVADQAQRRQQFQPSNAGGNNGSSSNSNTTPTTATTTGGHNAATAVARSQWTDASRFAVPTAPKRRTATTANGKAAANGTSNTNSNRGGYPYTPRTSLTAPGNGYASAGYGGSTSNASYYAGSSGYGGGSSNLGMRQRHTQSAPSSSSNNSNSYQEQSLQMEMQQRDTQRRLDEARQAETSLAELGTLFGKMSSLIAQQSETMDKIEDDVEAAVLDVAAGQDEITTLYTIKKGNRALIIKTFAMLIFLIIFMRFYAR